MNETLLAQTSLFASLPVQEIQRLAATLRELEFPPGVMLMVEGDSGDRFYIIAEGQLEIVKALGTVDERHLGIRGPGELVGEMSLLSGDGVRTASVRSVSRVRLLELTRADFDVLLRREPGFAYELLRMLSRRLRDAHNATIRDLQTKNRQLTQAYADLQSAQAQIVAEAQARARIEQELHVAHLIQQQFLPRELPELPGWQIGAYYRAAGAVGGDFYDFLELPDGQIGIVVGDVTDKGVPAALLMATTQSILRGEASRTSSPGKVLEQANERLVRDIPPNMFVTCLYGILDPPRGRLHFANAGHNFPLVGMEKDVVELRARGMPLGLMPGMVYEEVEATLAPGATMLLFSDGLVEAHSPDGEMFGFPRLLQLFGSDALSGVAVIEALLAALSTFTGEGWEQEDDVTLVTLRRS